MDDMRKNAQRVCKAFEHGRPCRPGSSIWTDGERIYSYAVPIAWRLSTGSVFVERNPERSSVTTQRHVNDVALYFGVSP
jgi:hypothetical protein